MKISVGGSSSKYSIIFIHGFGKTSEDWNTTSSNKPINLEKNLQKFANTINIDIEDSDYRNYTQHVAQQIHEFIKQSATINTKITVVAHSYGCFYAMQLAILYPEVYKRLVLLEPTLKTQSYQQKLAIKSMECSDPNDIIHFKSDTSDSLPDPQNLKGKVILRIHINIDRRFSQEKILKKIKNCSSLAKNNSKSRLFTYYDISHMVHYKAYHIITDDILEIYKK